jgi:hypothetical protein
LQIIKYDRGLFRKLKTLKWDCRTRIFMTIWKDGVREEEGVAFLSLMSPWAPIAPPLRVLANGREVHNAFALAEICCASKLIIFASITFIEGGPEL